MQELNKEKILFLWLNEKEFHAVNSKRRGVEVSRVYKDISDIMKVIRRINLKFNFFPIGLWLESWVNDLNKYETVIIHASILTPAVVKFIKNKEPNLNIIVWYWNPVLKCVNVNQFPKDSCTIFTFDESDAEKYDLKLNSQYYFNDNIIGSNSLDSDVFFVGADKGRLEMLLNIEKKFNDLGLKTDFHITDSGHKNSKNYHFKSRMDYDEVRNKIAKSKAILDIVSENQIGLTIRPLEAIYYNKKLITNDVNIVNRDFYNQNDFFIIGVDDISTLNDFLNSPMQKKSDELLKKYDFDSWLTRLFY